MKQEEAAQQDLLGDKQPGAPKAKKADSEAEARRARKLRLDELNQQGMALEDEALTQLGKIAGIKIAERLATGGRGVSPIDVRMAFIEHTATLPKSIDEQKFDVAADGAVAMVEKVCTLIGHTEKVRVALDDITLAEARKIQAILGDKRFQIGINVVRTGKQLRNLTPKVAAVKHAETKEKQAAAKDGPEHQAAKVREFVKASVDASNKTKQIASADLHKAYSAYCKANKLQAIGLYDNAWGAALATTSLKKKRTNKGFVFVGGKLK